MDSTQHVPFVKRYRWADELGWSTVDLGDGQEEDLYTLDDEAKADGWEDRYTPHTFHYIKEYQKEIEGDIRYMQIAYDPYQ